MTDSDHSEWIDVATAADDLTTPSKMSGGEVPIEERNAYLHLRDLIQREPDVHLLHDLLWMPEEMRWLYLIETPFPSFPKFVIGSTDPENLAPDILFQCGAEWSARDEWSRLTNSRPR